VILSRRCTRKLPAFLFLLLLADCTNPVSYYAEHETERRTRVWACLISSHPRRADLKVKLMRLRFWARVRIVSRPHVNLERAAFGMNRRGIPESARF
jgi:hypothetical protein